MKFAIISSTQDPSGTNIKEQMLSHFAFKETKEKFDDYPIYTFDAIKGKDIKLYTIKEYPVFAEHLDKRIEADLFIFITKHESKNKVHSLTVHSVGNYGKPMHGGEEKRLGIWPGNYMKAAYKELKKQAASSGLDKEFEVTLEVTHHGPLMDKPLFFIEIGSDMAQWQRKDAGLVIAKTVMAVLEQEVKQEKALIAFGGLHYCHNLIKILDQTDYCLGHLCPKYALGELDSVLLKQMMERTHEEVEFAVLDWKGLGEHKDKVVKLLEDNAIPFKKLKTMFQEQEE